MKKGLTPEQLDKAFDVHPPIIIFPEHEAKEIAKASERIIVISG